jgi:hypothetical protein
MSPAPPEGARRGEARPKFEEGMWQGGSHHGKGAMTTSARDSGAVVGPSVAKLDSRQRWRERKGGRRSCGANPRGTGAGEGGGDISPFEAERGNGGRLGRKKRRRGGGVRYGERHATGRWGGAWHGSRSAVARGWWT